MSNYNSPMNLAASKRRADARSGMPWPRCWSAMAVMAVLLSVAMPTWSHMIRREKEEELIFRGTQYARAINQYQRKFANASPASLDVLIEQHLLRKKFRDPMSPNKDGEFQMLYLQHQGTGRARPGAVRACAPGAGSGSAGGGAGSAATGAQHDAVRRHHRRRQQEHRESIRVYNGKTHYNEWQFIGMEQSTQAGSVAPARRGGPQRGGRGGDGRRSDGGGGRTAADRFGGGGVGGRGGQRPGRAAHRGRSRGGPSPQR